MIVKMINLAIYQPCAKLSSEETKQQKENRRFSSSVPSVPIASPAANIEVKTLVPQNLSKPSHKGKILVHTLLIIIGKSFVIFFYLDLL